MSSSSARKRKANIEETAKNLSQSKDDDDSAAAAAAPAPSSSAVKGASLLIGLQVASRLVTFAANQLLLRLLTAPLLGLSAQLEVYYLSVLFFARESLRVAIQRSSPTTRSSASPLAATSQAVVNLGYLAIPLGAVASLGLGWMYLAYASEAVLAAPHLPLSLRLYGLAAMLELLSEPCFVLMQVRLQFGTRAAAESIATFLRCAVVFGSAAWSSKHGADLGVLPFALGQLAYGITLLLVYLISGFNLASKLGFSILPSRVVDGSKDPNFLLSYFYRPTISLAGSMMAQSVVKHLLTQGDTFLVSLLSTPEVQGVYALVNNYGGLVARLLFQPVEESSRSYFSRLLSTETAQKQGTKDRKPSPAVEEARASLSTIIRLYLLLSLIVVTLGPFAAHPLLAIVAGSRWIGSGAGSVLAAYCFYIPFLAINGIAESFVASVATESEVHRQSGWMSAFSVAFGASAFLFMSVFPLGATGLIIANAINMLCRIVWCAIFIRGYFYRHGTVFILNGLVTGDVVALCVGTIMGLRQFNIAETAETSPLKSLGIVALFAIGYLPYLERKLLLGIVQSIRNRRTAKS